MRRWLYTLATLLISLAASGQEINNREEAEARLQALQVEIRQLQQQLEQSREAQTQEQQSLKALDLEIQDSDKTLRGLAAERQEHKESLAELEIERGEILDDLGERRDQLADQIVSAYRLGSQSRLKLLLNMDNPARIGRLLSYYDYINRARVTQINGLRTELEELDQVQTRIDEQLVALDQVQQEQEAARRTLQDQRESRQEIIAQLSRQIQSDEARLQELSQNQRDLQALVERLSNALADIPAELGQVDMASLRGRLPMPLRGRVANHYGQSRGAGLTWQGWLFRVNPGTEARAIGYGRVAFADWLRGYGLLMIIDHGNGFLSLYGNNESLLHDVGDWVEAGEVISVVGAGNGSDQGLYFELRKDGKAIDPALWLSR